jgi:CheY-like chemotaxis protein
MDVPKILIVEDDPDIRELAIMALEHDGGFSVSGCDNSSRAIEEARRLRPDLILLDWMLPGMDGGQTLEVLRSDPETAAIPVTFMTAKLRTSELEQIARLGASGVIAKPFDPMALPEQVRDSLNRARAAKAD